MALVAAALILHLCWARGAVSSLLALPVVVWIGRRSYGLYLYHRTLAALIPTLLGHVAFRYYTPIVLLVTVLITEASFRLVEQPVNHLGRAWLRERHAPAVRDAEFALPIADLS